MIVFPVSDKIDIYDHYCGISISNVEIGSKPILRSPFTSDKTILTNVFFLKWEFDTDYFQSLTVEEILRYCEIA